LSQLRRYEDAGRVVARDRKPTINAVNNADNIVPRPALENTNPPPQTANLAEANIPDGYYEADPLFEDEFESRQPHLTRNKGSGKGNLFGKVWNRTLLVVELAAVAGLIFVFVTLLQTLQATSIASADIQAQSQATLIAQQIPPTATPVINVAEVVLPEGHTVQLNGSSVVSASFNLDEVPAQFRTQYQSFVMQPLEQPTLSPQGPVRIQVPKINVNSTIVTGDTWQALQLGVGHHIGSANPVNAVIWYSRRTTMYLAKHFATSTSCSRATRSLLARSPGITPI